MELIELGCRNFRIIETSTLEHLIWMDRQVTEAGLSRSFRAGLGTKTADEFAAGVWEQISKSGQVFSLLAGMLIPQNLRDEDWTPEEAAKTIAFLKKLTSPVDHARIRSLLVSVVLGFFGSARGFAAVSDIASTAAPRAALQ